ncbi:MAG: hypothetical protein ACFFDT_24755 [Candidatus Hodarchaeota archaeon]
MATTEIIEDDNFMIRPGKVKKFLKMIIKDIKDDKITFEGVYYDTRPNVSIYVVKNDEWIRISLSEPLEVESQKIVQVTGYFDRKMLKLPSGKEYEADVFVVESYLEVDTITHEDIENEARSHANEIQRLMLPKKAVEERDVVQRIMWDTDTHQWIFAHFLHPPTGDKGSAIFLYYDKEGNITKRIVSTLKKPILE